jgi:hypothetical protein
MDFAMHPTNKNFTYFVEILYGKLSTNVVKQFHRNMGWYRKHPIIPPTRSQRTNLWRAKRVIHCSLLGQSALIQWKGKMDL